MGLVHKIETLKAIFSPSIFNVSLFHKHVYSSHVV